MTRRRFGWLIVVVVLIAVAVGLWPSALRWYAITQIEQAKREGIYGSPEEGMRDLIARHYRDIERVVIDHAGTNRFDGRMPHIWFVTARVYAAARGDGKVISPGQFDYPGSYFLRIDDGWVHVPEGAFPELVGRAMERFELYGCDNKENNCKDG